MQLVSALECGNCVITVSGTLSFEDRREWRRLCQLALEEDAEVCVLDLRPLENIDSAGLGMILALRTWVEQKDMVLKLRYNADNFVGAMMRLVKFDTMLLVDAA